MTKVTYLNNFPFFTDVSDQFLFRDHYVTLSYPVFLCIASKSVLVSKEPVHRYSKEETCHTATIDEYNNHASITEKVVGPVVTNQLPEVYSDYKIAMNKLLLPQDPDKGWSYIENKIFKSIGRVGKAFIMDIRLPSSGNCKNYVVCNFDVIISGSMQPQIVDIDGSAILPNKTKMADFAFIAFDGEKDSFVRVV